MEDRRLSSLKHGVLTLFGLGYLPGGATLASGLAVVTWLGLSYSAVPLMASLTVFAVTLALAAAVLAGSAPGEDPKEIVVDEFLGMYAALLFLPATDHRAVVIVFIAFRVLDVVKVPPFSWIDRWRAPVAILLDDLALGLALGLLYTCIAASLGLR